MSRLAVLHPTTLLGREVREVLEGRPELWSELLLLSTEEDEIGTLTQIGGAAAVVARAEPEELAAVDLVFFCGELGADRRFLEGLPAGSTAVVLSADATLADGRPVVAGVNPEAAERGAVLLSPHPAAILLAHLLAPLRRFELRRAVATVIQPTSMFGDSGLDALLEQTRHVLSMAGRASGGLFGGQLAFNLLPSQVAGEAVAEQVAAVLGGGAAPAVEILQGAVFHGMVASLWVELGGEPGGEEVLAALGESPRIEVAEEPAGLGPIDAAAADRVILGEVGADPAHPGGFWVRAVMDNLTLGGALNAVEVAAAVL